MQTTHRRLGLVGAAFAIAAVVVLWSATAAVAHALRISSDPDNGAVLKASPASVTVTFSEAPDPELSSIRVLDSSGGAHQQGKAAIVAGQPATLRVPVGHLADGVYTVAWQTLSRIDGHLASGSFAFGVRVSPAGAGTAKAAVSSAPEPSVWAVAARWSMYAGLMVLLGLAVFRLIAVDRTGRRIKKLAVGAWPLAAVGVVGITQVARSAAHVGLSHLLSSSLGHQLVLRAVPTMIAGVAVVLIVVADEGRLWPAAVLALASGAAMAGDVASSHAAAAPSWRWFQEGSQWVHFASGGVWVGGLIALVVSLGSLEAGERVRAARRFSTAAALALVLVAASGALRATSEVGAWGRLWSNVFGRWVLLKICLVVALAVLGALNRYRNVRKAADSPTPLRRTGAVELLVMAVVLVATGFLQNLAPASSTAARAEPAPVVVTGHDYATTVRIKLTIAPGLAGFNQFIARVTDFDTGKAVEADKVSLHFSFPSRPDVGSSDLTLGRQRDGSYQGQGPNLALDGRWIVTLLVARGPASVEVPLQVTTRAPQQTITKQVTAGLPTIYTIHLSGGRAMQVYLDSGRPGVLNEFHHTYLGPDGSELAMTDASVVATARGQTTSKPLTTRRLDALGHFVSDLPAGPKGRYGFQLDASTADGAEISAHIDIDVR